MEIFFSLARELQTHLINRKFNSVEAVRFSVSKCNFRLILLMIWKLLTIYIISGLLVLWTHFQSINQCLICSLHQAVQIDLIFVFEKPLLISHRPMNYGSQILFQGHLLLESVWLVFEICHLWPTRSKNIRGGIKYIKSRRCCSQNCPLPIVNGTIPFGQRESLSRMAFWASALVRFVWNEQYLFRWTSVFWSTTTDPFFRLLPSRKQFREIRKDAYRSHNCSN